MTWLLLALGCAAFVEVVARLDLAGQVRSAALVTRRIAAVIGSPRVSDHWKEKVLPRYAWHLLSASVRLFVVLLIAAAPLVLATLLPGRRGSSFKQLVFSGAGLAAATLFAVVYAAARSRLVGK